jgi:hypothetical protein
VTDGRGHFVLVLRPGPDPLYARRVLPRPRGPAYRLRLLCKRLLRELGFRVVDYRDQYPSEYLWTPGEFI